MSHKNRTATVDFDVGIGEIIPATQEAYHEESFSSLVKKEEKRVSPDSNKNFLREPTQTSKTTRSFRQTAKSSC